MIYKIIGEFDERISKTSISLNANGVCYIVNTPECDIETSLKEKKSNFYIHHIFSQESGSTFYGFLDKKNLDWFKNMLKIVKLGPKIALSIISSLKYDEFCNIVKSSNEKEISKIKGVGPKIAARILIEYGQTLSKIVIQSRQDFKSVKKTLSDLGFESKDIDIKFENILSKNQIKSEEDLIKKFLEIED